MVERNSVQGGCYCGVIRFELTFPTEFCSHCHSEDCRRTHGAAYVTWTGLPTQQFRFISGENQLRKYESHPGIRWGFCGRCGTSLLYDCDDAPEKIYVTVACLDGPLDRDPDSHVSFEEHVKWGLGHELPRYLAKSDQRIEEQAPSAVHIPLLDANTSRDAMIEPSKVRRARGIPKAAVVCFFQEVIGKLVAENKLRRIATLRSEKGENPVYEAEFHEQKVTVFHPGVGCPLAAGFLEEVIALGGKCFVACGGAGVLDSSLPVGTIVLPNAAVRDEGTSFHYLPPSREVAVPEQYLGPLRTTLEKHHCKYVVAKTWTTDAIYRETPERIQLRKTEGCITVEMEAAAFFAVAQFRGVPFGQLLYGGDDVGGSQWDSRDWDRQASVREKLFWLATEASLALADACGIEMGDAS